jgi:hypothetical protein
MKQRIDIMVDLETLGKTGEYSIIQIGAVAFDIKTAEYIKTFNMKCDIEKDEFFKVDANTLKWWLETDKELLYELLKDNKHGVKRILYDFNNWIWSLKNKYKNIYMWGNGIMFDNKIIKETFEKYNMEYPIYYKNDRDLRTVLDLAFKKLNKKESEIKEMFNNNKYKKHNGIDDCKYQIELLCYCWHHLTKKGGSYERRNGIQNRI